MAIKQEELNILIAIPCYGGNMKVPFVTSLMALSQRLAHARINHNILIIGDSLIPRLRNNFASVLLHEQQFSHMLFLDVDIEFTPDAILHMIDLEKELIGVAYTRKSLNWINIADAAKAGMEPKQLPEIGGNLVAVLHKDAEAPYGAPLKVAQVGTGLMLIKRTVFEKMRDAFPDLKYKIAENEPGRNEREWCWDFFGCFIDPQYNTLLSEDYAFCHRAEQLGIETWLLTCHRTVHWGDYGFIFNMNELDRVGQQPKEFNIHQRELEKENVQNDSQ